MRGIALPMNRTQAFIELADQVLALIREEFARSKNDRVSRASDADLNYALRRVEEMRRRALDRTLPERSARYPVLSRLIIDHWRLGGELGTAIVELEQRYEKI